ncbi:unnamed protein product [Kuraishia capsulata CBS 1993]|uniref:Protein kinase domain-containing protein n=1 Tax=Kuraishia capsulata CBS 1993 TaxID=1382522 RepID=W6MHI6_9ASCO|nr:uncharacterized protein KUCA_T00001130001 [Kuraishia capsulata CBS 1993]CDK25163.1 unnamed protein product [Kuraishia capsulata CBS 1993]
MPQPMFRFDEEEAHTVDSQSGPPDYEVLELSDEEFVDQPGPTVLLGTSSASHGLHSFHLSARRKSSVLRRMSVGSILSQQSHEFTIKSYDTGKFNLEPEPQAAKVNISEFEPIKALGQGAYGKVILVKRKSTGQLFAQKELKKASVIVNKQVERTMAERTILAQISNHPNIVKLFYALHDHEKVYLLLEYIPGGELFRHLAQRRVFSESVSAFYTAQMALALKHLHGLGIVYRDLKPENCLLDSRGFLVLTDFGLSKESDETVSDKGFCKSIIGTPEYMAPEVLRGEDYSYGVDWWSLGAVLFDMITGNPPFTGNSHKAISDKIIRSKVAYPTYLSAYAKTLLSRLLNKNPAKRLGDDRWDDFKKERFFREIHWGKLFDQDPSIVPPIIPSISNPELAENFDEMFTSMKLSSFEEGSNIDIHPGPINIQENTVEYFNGFSYTAKGSFVNAYMRDHST